ncbi:MAG: biopolymer transporter ExbD [Hyphomonadaceae bacterium]
MSMLTGSNGRFRGRRAMNAEINVTPFVDVMLVLLIVFMITAPLLTKGVDVTLPKAAADPLPPAQEQPLSVTMEADGTLYIQETEIEPNELIAKLNAITGEGYEGRIYLRVDESVDYGIAIGVMTRIQGAGYRNLALVTDPKATRRDR